MQQVYKDNLNKPLPYVPADDCKKPRTDNLYVYWTHTIFRFCVYIYVNGFFKCFFIFRFSECRSHLLNSTGY